MANTLRELLIQRAARLQERPALTAPNWNTLSYAKLRNRVEGVAMGLLATTPPSAVYSATGTPWDWIAELAAAASGVLWDPAGQSLPRELLGGLRFNDEAGRGPYHAREQGVQAATPFVPGLEQGELLTRLRRLNVRLGWDHTSEIELPLPRLGEPATRAALWSLLYAGGHGLLRPDPQWDPRPFADLWLAPASTSADSPLPLDNN